jgi:Protein of unknown function (DUF2721)
MTLEISTPALLFPAISLLFLSYTNRFLHLAGLIRQLHSNWLDGRDESLIQQIDNIRHRLSLIRTMQVMGAIALLLCVVSMIAIILSAHGLATISFSIALALMGGSLICLCREVWISGGALRILLREIDQSGS